jgi:hypothetical protein
MTGHVQVPLTVVGRWVGKHHKVHFLQRMNSLFTPGQVQVLCIAPFSSQSFSVLGSCPENGWLFRPWEGTLALSLVTSLLNLIPKKPFGPVYTSMLGAYWYVTARIPG